jgi:serine/threonine protein kinase
MHAQLSPPLFIYVQQNHHDGSSCRGMDSKYQTLGRIGEGTYGVVFKAKDRESQRVLALKQIRYTAKA